MNIRTIHLLISSVVFLACGACVWVKPVPQSDKVQIITVADTLRECEHLGRSTAITMDKILEVDRNAEKIKGELEALARNNAVEMGGDSIMAISQPKDGRQTFAVYRCRK